MKRINLYIDEEILKYLKSLHGRVSDHIRYALEDYVEKSRTSNVIESKSQRKVGDSHGQ